MGAIKDVVDLTTQLANSIQDRKFAADLFKIIELISTVQVDQERLTENNIQLMSDKSALQNTITTLKSDITRLQQQISELQNPTDKGIPEISDLMKQILFYSSESPEGISISMVQHKLNISNAKSGLEIGKLQDSKLLDYGSLAAGQDIIYVPTHQGLALLDRDNLI